MQAGEREMGDPDTRPMVYDGYFGCFVPVEDASFDVATAPEAIVELPWEPAILHRPSRPGRKGRAAH
jgi:hypothetical protein